jgi:hypothetical protein
VLQSAGTNGGGVRGLSTGAAKFVALDAFGRVASTVCVVLPGLSNERASAVEIFEEAPYCEDCIVVAIILYLQRELLARIVRRPTPEVEPCS